MKGAAASNRSRLLASSLSTDHVKWPRASINFVAALGCFFAQHSPAPPARPARPPGIDGVSAQRVNWHLRDGRDQCAGARQLEDLFSAGVRPASEDRAAPT